MNRTYKKRRSEKARVREVKGRTTRQSLGLESYWRKLKTRQLLGLESLESYWGNISEQSPFLKLPVLKG